VYVVWMIKSLVNVRLVERDGRTAAVEKGDWNWLWGVSSGRLWKYFSGFATTFS